ncbi:hypothetical protein PybrP1_003687 [[Pythium] brassicae (nom. inval.)]|nr:hypothetical protein PybrP1_003687 [[Pythium] brassicae (nom. inval.)]
MSEATMDGSRSPLPAAAETAETVAASVVKEGTCAVKAEHEASQSSNTSGDEDVDMEHPADNIKSEQPPTVTPPTDAFFAQLAALQQVDVFCTQTKTWMAARIEDVSDAGVSIHYMGWNKASDELIEDVRARVAPRGFKAVSAWAAIDARQAKRKRNAAAAALADADANSAAAKKLMAVAEVDPETEPSFVAVGATRSGRQVTKRLVNTAEPKRPALKEKAPSDAKKAAAPAVEVLEDDLCAACGQIEDDELTDMILCDGGCLSSYHFSCLGIEAAPEGEQWLCEQCRTNEQKCFACGRNGTINEKGGVFCCGAPACGKFYHQSCVSAHRLSRRFKRGKDGADEDALEFDAPFRCPRHVCTVCEDAKKGSDLMYCIRCPESYHPQCVPPSARYNSVALLCSRHPLDQLPKIPSFYYSDPLLDTVTVDFNLRLPLLFMPKAEPDAADKHDCHHFRLLLNLVEDVRQKAPPYKKLGRSIYTFKKPPTESLEDAPTCVCTSHCGDDCINRLSFTECYGPAPTPGMKLTKLNRESNCGLGEACGNRALHQKLYPRFDKFYTPDKGWALRLLEPVKAGQLVIEYVGEVVNEDEKERRLQHHARTTPEDKNMYIMELSKGVYIDARFKGSVSRYINHSCAPNCHLLKWRVKGENRIAITALEDIPAGEELSYDYQFHTQQAMEWRCHCKTPACRGTMAPEKINQGDAGAGPEKKLTKKEQLQRMKRAKKHEKIQQGREVKLTARRLSLTSQLCGFGDTGGKSLVRVGPAPRELAWAKLNRLFLARNATRGFDFLKRKALKDRKVRAKGAGGHAKPELSSSSGGDGGDGDGDPTDDGASKRVLSPASSLEEDGDEAEEN